jgi:hypothetical protein
MVGVASPAWLSNRGRPAGASAAGGAAFLDGTIIRAGAVSPVRTMRRWGIAAAWTLGSLAVVGLLVMAAKLVWSAAGPKAGAIGGLVGILAFLASRGSSAGREARTGSSPAKAPYLQDL